MTHEYSDPGPGRGRLLSPGNPLVNPTGLLTGPAASAAVAAGGAFYLAGGPVAFSQVEILSVETGGILTEIAALDGYTGDLSTLTAPRALFAGVDLAVAVSMGIVNVTPDSFSDGGDYSDPAIAIDHALKLAEDGAAIVDIGGESTRPGAEPLSVADEIARVMPVIEAAVAAGVTVSIDTRRAEVMKAAIGAGAKIVNDITALAGDPDALDAVAGSDASVILMHMQGTPETMQAAPQYRLASFDICHWLNARVNTCIDAGIPRERIAVDPGIGFGKTDKHNTEILFRAGVFHAIGCALVFGVSRKSFIGRIAGIDDPRDRLPGTIAATCAALDRGVQIHRVHDVGETRQAISIWNAVHDNG